MAEGHISTADFKGPKLIGVSADSVATSRQRRRSEDRRLPFGTPEQHFRKINHNRFNWRELAPA
jgi:hypothetical protein